MTQERITVLLDSELLTLGRACGVLRRRNVPIRGLSVDSNGPPGTWRLSCEIEADDATVANLVLQIQNIVGVRKATVSSPPDPRSVPERGNAVPSLETP
jgi:acetolactate synthase small subunit